MNAHTARIVAALSDRKGQSLNVRLESTIEPLAAHRSNLIRKVTTMTVVSGVSFENRIDIRDAIAAGERGEVQPLPWGQWEQFPHVIAHKGADYIRLYLPSQAQQAAGFGKTTVQFLCNGAPISRDEAVALCGAKAQAKENGSGCMTVKADNLALVV